MTLNCLGHRTSLRGSSPKGLALKVRFREELGGGRGNATQCPCRSSCKCCKARNQCGRVTPPGIQPSWPRRPGEEASRMCVQTAPGGSSGSPARRRSRGRRSRVGTAATWPVPAGPIDDSSGQSLGTMPPSSPHESGERGRGVTSSLIQASSSPVFRNSLASKPLVGLL